MNVAHQRKKENQKKADAKSFGTFSAPKDHTTNRKQNRKKKDYSVF